MKKIILIIVAMLLLPVLGAWGDISLTCPEPGQHISAGDICDITSAIETKFDGGIDTDDLNTGAVTSAKIADGSVMEIDLAASSVTLSKVTEGVGQDFCVTITPVGFEAAGAQTAGHFAFVLPPDVRNATLTRISCFATGGTNPEVTSLMRNTGGGWLNLMTDGGVLSCVGYSTVTGAGIRDTFDTLAGENDGTMSGEDYFYLITTVDAVGAREWVVTLWFRTRTTINP